MSIGVWIKHLNLNCIKKNWIFDTCNWNVMVKLQTMMNNDIFAMVNYYRSTGKLLKQFIPNTLYLNPFFFHGSQNVQKIGWSLFCIKILHKSIFVIWKILRSIQFWLNFGIMCNAYCSFLLCEIERRWKMDHLENKQTYGMLYFCN